MGTKYLVDVGSSTVKVYERTGEDLRLSAARSFGFKEGFSSAGLAERRLGDLIQFFLALKRDLGLVQSNSKIFATGIFRELDDPRGFVEDFYARTGLYFNIVSHEMEAFYLEAAWKSGNDSLAPMLVINIGGRTTELITYDRGVAQDRILIQVGVGVILAKHPEVNRELSEVMLKNLVREIRSELPTLPISPTSAVYTGGELNYMQLAGYRLVENQLFDHPRHPYQISLQDYVARNDEIFSSFPLSDLRELMPSNPNWMDGARACSALAQAVCEEYGVETIVPSDSNLVDGVNACEARSVVLCGSFRKHLAEIAHVSSVLRSRGIRVLSPASTRVSGSKDGFVLFEGDRMVGDCTWSVESPHLQAIESADMVVVCNVDNYLGVKTALEVGYAYRCGKKIVFLNDGADVRDLDLPSEIGLLQF